MGSYKSRKVWIHLRPLTWSRPTLLTTWRSCGIYWYAKHPRWWRKSRKIQWCSPNNKSKMRQTMTTRTRTTSKKKQRVRWSARTSSFTTSLRPAVAQEHEWQSSSCKWGETTWRTKYEKKEKWKSNWREWRRTALFSSTGWCAMERSIFSLSLCLASWQDSCFKLNLPSMREMLPSIK